MLHVMYVLLVNVRLRLQIRDVELMTKTEIQR